MNRLTKSDLRALLEYSGFPHLTFYMPTHRAGHEVQQNPVRFKNLLREAENALSGHDLTVPDIQEFLEPARSQLAMNETFWQQQSDGLVIFIAPELLQYYRLPIDFEEAVLVGNQFYITPVLEVFQNAGQFYILALSQNETRLLEGTKDEVKEVEIKQLPPSLVEALKWDDPEKQLQGHAVSRGRQGGERGRPDMSFHGHGSGKDDDKTNILRYFRMVDKALSDFFANERIPLVLAGVEYLLPIYREANSYNYLAEQGIPGNPDALSAEVLHTRAWELLAPRFKMEQLEAAALYRQQAGQQTGRTLNDVVAIVQSAYAGRVGQLFIQKGSEIWGRYDLANNQVELHPERIAGSEDLLNTAAVYSFQNDGVTHVVEQNDMPDEASIAAILRY